MATLIMAVAAGFVVWRHLQTKKAPHATLPIADYGAVADFSLTERSGKKVTLADLKGKPWVANFIFTRCAGPCPMMSYNMSKLQKEFLASTNLQFVSFSVDPEYDTPTILTQYAATYEADPTRWYFLTGKSRDVYELILKSFHLATEKSEGTQVNHSLHFVLVGGDGHIRGYYNGEDSEALSRLRYDIKSLARS